MNDVGSTNLHFFEEVLAWGKLQQILFNNNESYQKKLKTFIKSSRLPVNVLSALPSLS